VATILEKGLDRIPYEEPRAAVVVDMHRNLRGPAYYARRGDDA
jgi:hypothetical protein